MAIHSIEYQVTRLFRERNHYPLGGDLLEIGESEWSGDLDPSILREDISKYAHPTKQQELLAELDEAIRSKRPSLSWEIARIYWHTFLQPASITAIDCHGTNRALKLNLNSPIDLKRQYHIVNNAGTLEHVFNIGQAFQTLHDHTLPGGFMIHQSPFTGWIDHGFFNLNPTLYFDLAAANNYNICVFLYMELNSGNTVQLTNREQILGMANNNEIGKNSMLMIVLQRPDVPQPFRFPVQGYYSGSISAEAAKAWQMLR